MSKKNIKNILYAIFLSFIIFVSGIFIGGAVKEDSFVNIKVLANEYVDLDPFWKVWKILEDRHMPPSESEKISDEEMVYGAIKGLVKSLNDPYTVFLPPEENEDFEESIQGEFSGVGMEVSIKDGVITIVAPLKNTPAERAGLKSGDIIAGIDEQSTMNMSIDEAVKLIRGPVGTIVKLSILREGGDEILEIQVTREKINIPTLDTEIIDDDIFMVSLYNFSGNISSDFTAAMKEFILSGKRKLILDLRGNPGGFLDAAIEISSWFLPKGDVVAIEDFGDKEKIFRSYGYDNVIADASIVVLVDEGSASASEIVAGALQDNKRAKIIGQKTFGKGSVQALIPITPETSLKVTVARWLTPNRRTISQNGLEPDIIVDEAPEGIELNDYQLQKAIEALK